MSDPGRRRRNPLRPHVVAGSPSPSEPPQEATAAPDESTVSPEAFEQEPFGWFREEPEEVASAEPRTGESAPPASVAPAAGQPAAVPLAGAADVDEPGEETGDQAEAGEIAELGEEQAELPVAIDATTVSVAAAPPAGPAIAVEPRRGQAAARLRTLIVSVIVVALTAALGFAAGTMLPTVLPGPGIAGGPTASSTPASTPTPAQTPTSTPSPTPTVAPSPTPTPTLAPTSTPAVVVHVVKAGENLTMIAARYGVTVKAIQAANKIKDPNKIVVGQKLIIPPKP